MDLKNAVALVTGSNRGIGMEIVRALVGAGVKGVYAAMRDPAKGEALFADSRVTPVALDVTDEELIATAVESCNDVDLLINNAGVNLRTGFIAAKDLENARRELEVNYFGPFRMCRAFAPVLAANGGGMIVNVISSLAQVCIPEMGSLCASKGAYFLLTQGVRAELRANGTHVMAVFPGSVKTDMVPYGEAMPEDIAAAIVEAIGDEVEDLYPSDQARRMMMELKQDPKAVEREHAKRLPK